MNRDNENRMFYKDTFDEVHAPDELLRKVKNMKIENKDKVRRISKRFVCAAASLAIVGLVSSNAIAYAATGSTWVEKIIVSVDGKGYEAEIYKSDEDNAVYEFKNIDDGDGGSVGIKIESGGDSENASDSGSVVITDGSTGLSIDVEGERTYLKSGEQKIDITDNFVDGKSEGEIDIKGESYHYVVTNNDGVYSIKAEKK